MCGRFALYSDPFTLARRFEADAPPELSPRYNVAPSQNIPIVRDEGEKRRFALARWGLIPHWAKDMKIGYSTINARAETVASKPAFRNAFRHRRCLIPADGFYGKPYQVQRSSNPGLSHCGTASRWRLPDYGNGGGVPKAKSWSPAPSSSQKQTR